MLSEAVERLDVQRLMDRVLETFWNRPGYEGARPSQAELRAFMQWNVDLIIRWAVEGQPPTDSELDPVKSLARELAIAGVPADVVPANYRLGMKLAWRELPGMLGDMEREVFLDRAYVLLEYVDRVSSVFAAGYEEGARGAAASATERGLQALLTRLRRGERLLEDDHHIAEAIGFDLGAPAYAFAVVCPPLSVPQHLALARQLRTRRVLAVAERQGVSGLAPEPAAWSNLALGAEAIMCEAFVLAPADAGPALNEVSTVVGIARDRGRRGVVTADEFLIDLMLSRCPGIAARVTNLVYGPLPQELVRTVDVLAECNFDRGQAARALPTHRNTLRNRLARIHELTGVDVDDVEGRALTTLAWLNRRGALASGAGAGH